MTSRRSHVGDTIAYRLKDSHGEILCVGVVTGYSPDGKLVHLRTTDDVSISVAPHVPVLVPIVWADTFDVITEPERYNSAL